jgi:hypothetical protein
LAKNTEIYTNPPIKKAACKSTRLPYLNSVFT